MQTNSKIVNLALLIVLAIIAWNISRPQTPVGAQPQPAVQSAALAALTASTDAACDSSRTVQVSGAAVVTVVPDRALLQLGVRTTGSTPDGTHNLNVQAIQQVIRAVRALGVAEQDIATDYFIVYPVYEDYNSLFIKGYQIDNTISITLRDVELADDVILAAIKAGANEVQDIQFYTSELRKYRDQAREMAVKAAGEKAQALAGAAGAQAGCVLSINENTWSQYYGSWRGGRDTMLWAQNTIQNVSPSAGSADPAADSPISLGKISVRAEVNLSYSLLI